jgi:hypothetical protein
MANKKRSIASQKQGLLIFTTPNSQAHKIIENWNEYRPVGSEELHSTSVKDKKEAKTDDKIKVEPVAGVGQADWSAASILGYR